MKKQVPPAVAVVVIVLVVAVAATFLWRGTQKSFKMPDKPPSGPILLPPSQQGRMMPSGQFSGTAAPPSSEGR
ncbi:MAG TPA: hypothetical protein VFB21_15595 [Chthonomonadaceae bacterium]|jgi:hypothetical protein|nr:hypothetical protein [Chthonomonadaceae bacterium]